jgi:hypothetical protein
LVGVCMTVVGIVKAFHGKGFVVSAVVSVASVVFLLSTFCAYTALRHDKPTLVDAVAEYLFLGGLVLVTVAGIMIAVEIL